MTSEKRTTIELKDIKTIELECQKCHSKIVRPIEAWFGSVAQCSNCNEPWMLPQAQDLSNLNNLVNALLVCKSQMNDKQPYRVRLEIGGLEP
jgi:hypothetical protein